MGWQHKLFRFLAENLVRQRELQESLRVHRGLQVDSFPRNIRTLLKPEARCLDSVDRELSRLSSKPCGAGEVASRGYKTYRR